MPIIRENYFGLSSPHIYEIFFSLNGSKSISYIGKSAGEHTGYISGSSELNRVIANTILCFGKDVAQSGWQKVVLARYPGDTPDSVLESEEKKFILAAYDECRRLGPGRCWEILNKGHLQKTWKSDAQVVLDKLRHDGSTNANFLSERGKCDDANRSAALILSPKACTSLHTDSLTHSHIPTTASGNFISAIEANFFDAAAKELGRNVAVPITLMAYPGRKRTSTKLRVLLCVVLALQRNARTDKKRYALKTSTLRFLIREPTLNPQRVKDVFGELSTALDVDGNAQLSELSFGSNSIQFLLSCDTNPNPASSVSINYEKFIRVASEGQQSSLGRRYFTIIAAHQLFQKTGQGIPFMTALMLLSGKQPPTTTNPSRLKEFQSTCRKGIKSSEKRLQDLLGYNFATNYFTKKKLRYLESEFKDSGSDFRVLLDNSERPLSDFFALLSQTANLNVD